MATAVPAAQQPATTLGSHKPKQTLNSPTAARLTRRANVTRYSKLQAPLTSTVLVLGISERYRDQSVKYKDRDRGTSAVC
jgi:hypothetical protein